MDKFLNRLTWFLFGMAAGIWLAGKLMDYFADYSRSQEVSVIQASVIQGSDMQERVKCQFEEPLKHITLIMHYYDDRDELNLDWNTYGNPEESDEEIWGWSDCAWQPRDNAAWCDMYVMKPEFVHGDMDIDTAGHELTHATCGDFHD